MNLKSARVYVALKDEGVMINSQERICEPCS